jgi:hypothetical protein
MGRPVPALSLSLLLSAAVASCHDPVTEVVVVMQSDLSIPGEAQRIAVSYNAGPLPPLIGGVAVTTMNELLYGRTFPLSIGFTSGGNTSSFSITTQLLKGVNQGGSDDIAVSRTVTDIRFVDETMTMLVLPLLRACACDGTSCPTGNSDCDSLHNPAVQPLDPAVAGTDIRMFAP